MTNFVIYAQGCAAKAMAENTNDFEMFEEAARQMVERCVFVMDATQTEATFAEAVFWEVINRQTKARLERSRQ